MLKETIEKSSDRCDTYLTRGETDGNHGCAVEVVLRRCQSKVQHFLQEEEQVLET